MNLPIFHQLLDNQSTYLTFSKSLLDFDKAINNGTEYYFSKMVALNLPNYQHPNFFLDLSEVNSDSSTLGDNPNITIPKGMQYYMENIIRNSGNENITELAFYKFLNKAGISYQNIHDSIVFVNKIMTSNFIKTENNNGWSEIVGVIPNNSAKLTTVFKNVTIPNVISTNDTDLCICDPGGNKEFLFTDILSKKVIDFDNLIYETVVSNTTHTFDFNCLLLFYKDDLGIDKLHGINFINPFENKVTYYELPKYTQKTNDSRSVGYQFKMNLKTVNNEATKIIVENYNDGFWTTHLDVLSKLGTFLELQIQNGNSIIT